MHNYAQVLFLFFPFFHSSVDLGQLPESYSVPNLRMISYFSFPCHRGLNNRQDFEGWATMTTRGTRQSLEGLME